ncbi:hypothetical protein [Sphingomonas radiodurans]|uniref:hypothetical protein n=1 Tax=Sphingomonas radiodurans TaxID=2890321 RepID=UPI001E50A1B7|nr:hypothetical protein [Sphingomonas radiodurans]WBH17050.1 hypothetical protein LLW23_02710 [Sphingomonas radiodurans]
MIADLEGGLNIAVFHDFRRPVPLGRMSLISAPTVAEATAVGSSSIKVGGFAPGAPALCVGDYIGGDGRPHLVSRAMTIAAGGVVAGAGTIVADASGAATIGFKPPLSAAVEAGTVLTWPVTGRFELISEDAGANETGVGGISEYVLDFVESLL